MTKAKNRKRQRKRLGGKMKINFLNKKENRAASCMSTVFLLFVIVIFVFTGPSYAFSTQEGLYDDSTLQHDYTGSYHDSISRSLKRFPSSGTDACLPLLKTIRHTPEAFVSNGNRHSAGQAAAFGLIIGMRFALSPPQQVKSKTRSQSRFDVWTLKNDTMNQGNGQVLAVSAYRKCQKDKALKALNTFRWAR